MRPDDSCLENDRLLALFRGELSLEDQEALSQHISAC